MTQTRMSQVSQLSPAPDLAPGPAPMVRDGARRGGRAAVRLWSLLHAEALLRGPAGGPGDVAWIEDDGRRLAARRAG
jgi:hypothetical protein